MFFSESHQHKAGIENIVAIFCSDAVSEAFSIDEQLKSVNITLKWLNALRHDFENKKEQLQSTQKKSADRGKIPGHEQTARFSAAMNTMIFILSHKKNTEQEEHLNQAMDLAIAYLRGKKDRLVEQAAKNAIETNKAAMGPARNF